MKKYLILTKILLKAGISNLESQGKKKRKFKIKSKLLYLFIFICFIPLLFSLFVVGREGYNLLYPIGQEGIVIGLVCAFAGIMTFVFGLSIVISVFYYTSDIEYLLPLPLKPYQIVAAKFTITLLYEYITTFVIVAPVLSGYGVASGAGAEYWITAVFAILLIPIVPLIYGGVLSMFIMMIFKKAKNRDLMTIVLSIFILVIVLGLNSMTNVFSTMTPEAIMELLVKGNNSLVSLINSIFPNFILIEKALINGDVFMLMLFALTIIVFIAVFLFLAKILYFKGAAGVSETSSKRKAMTKEEAKKIIRKRSIIYTYTMKELKLVFRSPMYFLNCVMIAFIWPIFFGIIFIGDAFGNGESQGFAIKDLIGTGETLGAVAILAVFGITIIVTSMNFTAGTSISREGKNFFVMKYIPMSYENQIFSKVLSGILISVLTATIYLLVIMIILKISPLIVVISTIISFFGGILFNYIQIVTDLIKPKLNWENEQAAIKQNFNTMIELVLTFIIGGGMCLIGIIFYTILNASIYILGIGFAIILLILIIIAHKLVTHFGARKLSSLE